MTEKCENEVIGAGAGSREEARAMLEAVESRAERIRGQTGKSAQDAARQAGQELGAEAAMAAAIERRNKVLNLNKRIARRQIMSDTAESVGKNGEPDLAHAVLNQEVARNTPSVGNRRSAEAEWKGIAAQYTGALANQLDREGLAGYFRDPGQASQWGAELFELSRQAAGEPDAKPGVTGSPQAKRAAEIVHGLQQLAKQRLNREGAWIGDYSGWISSTQHDRAKLSRAGFQAWRDYIAPRLDERTFEGVTDREGYLRKTYNALVSGVHLVDRERVGMKEPAFTGPGNLADRLSGERKLHFSDAQGWMQYQSRFGRGALNEQVSNTLDRSARALALLRRWGTNPEAELDSDVRWMQERYRDSNPLAVAKLGDARNAIKLRMDYLTGAANIPGNQRIAEIAAGIRAVESMAKLGGVAFTHLSAFTTKAAELRYHGVGFLERWGNSIGALMQGRGAGEQRQLADLLLAGVEGAHGHMLNRFTADDAAAGTMSKLANNFFRLSGLTWLLDAQKAGTGRIMSRWLGQHLDTGFGGLPPEMRRTLTSYGIAPEQWEALRAAKHFEIDGRKHLTPDAAETVPDDVIASLRPARPAKAKPLEDATLAEIDRRTRDDMSIKLQTLFGDIADRGIITPGIEDRALLTQGTKPGTLAGEALRFIAQFKTWGVAAARQGIGRELYGGQSTGQKIAGMMQLAAGTLVTGYLTMTLKSLFKGQTPRSPTDPRTWLAAGIQGGGFGILGDYAFGQFNRFNQSPVEALAGPAAGTASELLQLLALGRGLVLSDPTARAKDAGPEALRIAQNNTPFINLFYVRRALDYLLFHSLQESMNPGYLRRAERAMQRNTGQSYLSTPINMSPQNHLHTFGQ